VIENGTIRKLGYGRFYGDSCYGMRIDNIKPFDTIPKRDRQTDGLRELLYQYRASVTQCANMR